MNQQPVLELCMTAIFDLIAPPLAPLHSDGSLNLGAVEPMAGHFVQNGIAGVFVSGTSGESQSLTVQERLALAQRWLDVSRSTDLHVIIQVGHNCVEDARIMARHAQSEGADAVATLSPSFLKPETVEDLIDCCRPVAQAAGDLPFYLYDIPSVTDVSLPMHEFLIKGKEALPNLRGLKFTNTDMMQLQECLHLNDGEFDILFGCDQMLLAGVMFGCPGAVGTTYNFAAGHYRRMINAFHAGDLTTARRLQHEAVRMIRVFQKYGFLSATKVVLRSLGIDCGPVRAPLRPLTADQDLQLLDELSTEPALADAELATA
jgi:N-acetylneuraminate lyase